MSWTAADIPDQHGRVAVVTGGNGGLGLETSRELARRGAHVVMAARNLDKAETACASIVADVPDVALEVRELDLGALSSVHACADAILGAHDRIDLLVNNAGVMAVPEGRTADGFETQLGVNHLGHFVLTHRLLPALLAAPAGRVVTVTSTARHLGAPLDPDNPHLDGDYEPWRAYAQSKLANLHFAVELHRRLMAADASVASLAAHPGLSNTDLQATAVRLSGGTAIARFWHSLARTTGMPADRGALPQLRAATDPSARSGQLYAPRWGTTGPPEARPLVGRSVKRGPAWMLWDVSERETGTTFDVDALVRGQAA